ncbi:hypothetical protein HBI81_250570 [Parastagonospora nodorum]|nr:hypothetical protein HBI81_250570 [Parastagonospora nodorum]
MDGTGGSIERWATESRLRKELLVVTQAVSKPTSSAISVLVAFSRRLLQHQQLGQLLQK